MPKRLALASVSGLSAFLAYPSINIWPFIFLTIAGLYLAVRGLGFWRGMLVGLVGGFAFYAAQIYWISQYLGPEPLIALAGMEAIFFAVGSGLISLISKLALNPWQSALAVSTLWNAREFVATHFPYGGFPWSRIAMSQADSPFAFWVSVGGNGLLTFIIVFIVIFAVEKVQAVGFRQSLKPLSIVVAFALVIPLGLSLLPMQSVGFMRIAGIQGNANAGLFANFKRGEILQNHLDATETLLKSGKPFDLVVWPENASDINPDNDVITRLQLENLVNNRLKTPLIFGTITTSGKRMYNSSKLWLPGRGEVDQYDKKRPVPFGEYVPDRAFFYALSPDLVGEIYRGYNFGTRDGIFNVKGRKLGILICFEEAIDELPREVVSEGASVLIAQTNNSDFGHSDETFQQTAIAKLRAIETGRSLVNVSTVGPSTIFDAKGNILSSTKTYVAGHVIANVPLVTSKNLAMLGGWMFDPACAGLGLVIALWLILRLRRTSSRL